MFWRLPLKTYFKKGSTSVALTDFSELQEKKVKVVFSGSLSRHLDSLLKKIKCVLNNKEMTLIEDIHLTKEIKENELVILFLDFRLITKVRALIKNGTNTMIFVPPFFSINHLGSENNKHEIIVADIALFNGEDDYLNDAVRAALWNTLSVSLHFAFIDPLSKKNGVINEDTLFLFRMKDLWSAWVQNCNDCIEKTFHTTLLASIELQQQTELFTTLSKYTIPARKKVMDKVKKLKLSELTEKQKEVLKQLEKVVGKKITTQNTLSKMVNEIDKFYR